MRMSFQALVGVAAAFGVFDGALAASEPTAVTPPIGSVSPAAVLSGVPGPGVITNPDWEARPSGEDIGRFYPSIAQFLKLNGRVTLACAVASSGVLRSCEVESEAPKGVGFGDAAIGMTGLFKMRPMWVDGRPVGGATVRIPLRFMLPEEKTAPAAPKLPAPSPQALALGRRIASATLPTPVNQAAMLQGFKAGLDLTEGAGSEERRAVDTAVEAGMKAFQSELIDAQAALLASELSIEEMTEIAAFVESPAGRAWSNAGRVLMSGAWRNYAVIGANAQNVAHETFCAKVDCEIDPPALGRKPPAKKK